MKLLDALKPGRRSELRYTLDDYVSWVKLAGFGGNPYPIGNGVNLSMPGTTSETIGHNFGSYVQQGLAANGIVWTCASVRLQVFSQARLMYQRIRNGRPGALFGSQALSAIERPWPGATVHDLLAAMILHADFGGNAYTTFDQNSDLVLMRPDWVDIILEPVAAARATRMGPVGHRKFGYVYWPDGRRDGTPTILRPDDVAHFAPYPDPAASYRGMSWLTPVAREIVSDRAATTHKQRFFDNAATPNLAIKLSDAISPEAFDAFVKRMDGAHKGVDNAYKTLYLGGGADVTVVGSDFQQLDFKAVQGAGETRIAAASGVGAIIAQLSEGMQGSSLNAGNYSAARRRFSDIPMRHAWAAAAGCLQTIIDTPPDARLWYDDTDISFLQEDARDAAEIWSAKAAAIRTLTDGGFTPDSAAAATDAMDTSLLVHTGLLSVQMQPPGNTVDATSEESDV